VLKRFAAILKKNTRTSDICGRLGGDEFILVVTHVPIGHITSLAERLGCTFTIEEFTFKGENVQMTASFGVGGFEVPDRPDSRICWRGQMPPCMRRRRMEPWGLEASRASGR